VSDVNWCTVCDEYYAESRIDVLDHIHSEHTLEERLNSLIEKGAEPEDTIAT
jgi:hypothetical protein